MARVARAWRRGDEEGLLSLTVTDLAANDALKIRPLVGEVRREIAAVASAFDSPVEVHDGRREIAGLLALAWESLEGARSAKLARYGAVSPSVGPALDPHVERLIQLLFAIERRITRRPTG